MALDRTWYNALIDDDGSNTTGTGWNKAAVDSLMDAVDASLNTTQTTTSTGTVNNFAQTVASRLLLRCNNATLLTITGFTAGAEGDEITVVSIGAGHVNFSHQAAGSTAGNRLINFATSGVTPLAAGVGTATFRYDLTTARWRLVDHQQGAWITPTYAGTDYTASTGTWTVDAGDVTTFKFFLTGRQLSVIFKHELTSTSATPFALRFVVPGGFTLGGALAGSFVFYEGAVWAVGTLIVAAAGTYITLAKDGGGVGLWTTETNAKLVEGSCTIEVT